MRCIGLSEHPPPVAPPRYDTPELAWDAARRVDLRCSPARVALEVPNYVSILSAHASDPHLCVLFDPLHPVRVELLRASAPHRAGGNEIRGLPCNAQ